jgi:adenylosuccinate synthase
MSVSAVVGANWGDEGKGKISDVLAQSAQWVVRYQGGNNAGHTVVNDYGIFALHLLPSGVFHSHITNVLGPGIALNIPAFVEELEGLKCRGVPKPRALVSDRAQVVLPLHGLLDDLEEERLGSRQFGSTRSGIAPFYADKALKIGLRVSDLFERDRIQDAVERYLDQKNVLLIHGYGHQPFRVQDWVETLQVQAEAIHPYVTDTTKLVQGAIRSGERILLEGQLGALRDPDHGIHPFTTSSSPLAGFASVGAGIPPTAITKIVAVTKAYSSCIGAGPFVTELAEPEATLLRQQGEAKVNTGRPRVGLGGWVGSMGPLRAMGLPNRERPRWP